MVQRIARVRVPERNDQAAEPTRIAATLYEQPISSLERAVAAIADEDAAARNSAVQSATEALTALNLNLDVRRCNRIADQIPALYRHLLSPLLRIKLCNDPRIAIELIELLMPVGRAWAELTRSSPPYPTLQSATLGTVAATSCWIA